MKRLAVLAVVSCELFAVCYGQAPAPDQWTENSTRGWAAGAMSKDQLTVRLSTAQLVGSRAIEVQIRPGQTPATVCLSLGRPWNLTDYDQLVFAWQSSVGKSKPDAYPQVTVWAKNEIGEGFSRYAGLPITRRYGHLRLDLMHPQDKDPR